MDDLRDFIVWASSAPVIGRLIEWLSGLPHLSFGELIEQLVDAGLRLLGLTEFFRWANRRLFRRRTHIEKKNELLEDDLKLLKSDIKTKDARMADLEEQLRDIKARLPEQAIAVAEKELEYNNTEIANRVREKWLSETSDHIAQLAISTAKYHIGHAIADPTHHLSKANEMLRLAQAANAKESIAQELWLEFDQITAALQEQVLIHDGGQTAWNSNLRPELLITTSHDISRYCFNQGKYLLATVFADRTCELAAPEELTVPAALIAAESWCAWCYLAAGRFAQALIKIDRAIDVGRTHFDSGSQHILTAKYRRSHILSRIGRNDEALQFRARPGKGLRPQASRGARDEQT